MANEEIVEGDVELELPEVKEGEEDTTDYKTLASQFASSAKRYKKLFEKQKIEKKVEKGVEKVVEKTKDDYGKLVNLSFLNSLGISKEDHQYLLDEAESTGKQLDVVVDFKYVQEELKNRKEERMVKEAIPKGSKRSGDSSGDTAYYYFGKMERGEITLGQIPNKKLQQEVRKMKEQKYGGGTGMVFGSIRR